MMSNLKSALAGVLFFCAIAVGINVAQKYPQYFQPWQAPAVQTERITFDPGGELFSFIEKYNKARVEGTRYVIDGMCISACTLILGLIPENRVCVTPFAKLAFHSASLVNALTGERVGHAKTGTRLLWYIYPPKLREMLKVKFNWDGDGETAEHPELMFVEGDDLLAIYKPCKENT